MQTAQTTTLDTLDIPAGFKPRFFGDGFINANGPLYTRRSEAGRQMGFRVEPRHCNPMQICHGGMTAMVLSKDLDGRFLPTITLQVDYLGPSPLGAWVQGEAQILRTTRSLVFMQGLVHADGAPVARVSGIFKIGAVFAGFQPLAAAGT